MESTKKLCLLISLLLFLLLVSTVHGAQLADAKDTGAEGEGVAVRTGAAGHGHGYSSHSGRHPNGTPEQGGAGVVDPRNLAVRSDHRHGAATRALSYSSLASGTLVGVIITVVLL